MVVGLLAAADPMFHHLGVTYASETNETVGIWRAVPEELLDFKPHEKTVKLQPNSVDLAIR
jgi:hypothetical protein